jgi:uncharacterized membrane protein
VKELFEPDRPHRRLIFLSVLDVVLLMVLGVGFVLLDFVFRQILEPMDATFLRYLMVASWVVILILEVALAYLREKA